MTRRAICFGVLATALLVIYHGNFVPECVANKDTFPQEILTDNIKHSGKGIESIVKANDATAGDVSAQSVSLSAFPSMSERAVKVPHLRSHVKHPRTVIHDDSHTHFRSFEYDNYYNKNVNVIPQGMYGKEDDVEDQFVDVRSNSKISSATEATSNGVKSQIEKNGEESNEFETDYGGAAGAGIESVVNAKKFAEDPSIETAADTIGTLGGVVSAVVPPPQGLVIGTTMALFGALCGTGEPIEPSSQDIMNAIQEGFHQMNARFDNLEHQLKDISRGISQITHITSWTMEVVERTYHEIWVEPFEKIHAEYTNFMESYLRSALLHNEWDDFYEKAHFLRNELEEEVYQAFDTNNVKDYLKYFERTNTLNDAGRCGVAFMYQFLMAVRTELFFMMSMGTFEKATCLLQQEISSSAATCWKPNNKLAIYTSKYVGQLRDFENVILAPRDSGGLGIKRLVSLSDNQMAESLKIGGNKGICFECEDVPLHDWNCAQDICNSWSPENCCDCFCEKYKITDRLKKERSSFCSGIDEGSKPTWFTNPEYTGDTFYQADAFCKSRGYVLCPYQKYCTETCFNNGLFNQDSCSKAITGRQSCRDKMYQCDSFEGQFCQAGTQLSEPSPCIRDVIGGARQGNQWAPYQHHSTQTPKWLQVGDAGRSLNILCADFEFLNPGQKDPPNAGGDAKQWVRCCPFCKPVYAPQYVGCWRDNSARTLKHFVTPVGQTIEDCDIACSDAGFAHFALQAGGECRCGNGGYDALGQDEGCKCCDKEVGGWKNCVFTTSFIYKKGTDTLGSGEEIFPGNELRSKNGLYQLMFQSDGNLVLYKLKDALGICAVWATGTAGEPKPVKFSMDQDGNFVGRDAADAMKWESRTGGRSADLGIYLKLENDGHLVVYNPLDGTKLWKSSEFNKC